MNTKLEWHDARIVRPTQTDIDEEESIVLWNAASETPELMYRQSGSNWSERDARKLDGHIFWARLTHPNE